MCGSDVNTSDRIRVTLWAQLVETSRETKEHVADQKVTSSNVLASGEIVVEANEPIRRPA